MTLDTTPKPHCVCGDQETKILFQLVADGHDQVQVSHLLWGDPSRAAPATVLAFTTISTRMWVRRSFAAAFPWLRLPGGGR